jgi:hypothetical protein
VIRTILSRSVIVLLASTLLAFGVAGVTAVVPALLLILLFLIRCLFDGGVSRRVLGAWFALLAWLAWELVLLPNVREPGTHLLYLGFAALIVISITAGTNALIREPGTMLSAVYFAGWGWLIICLVSFVAYLIAPGPYSYSSVFENRNGFAVFSTILAAMLLGLREALPVERRRSVWLVTGLLGCLVAASLSVKGVVGFSSVLLLLGVKWKSPRPSHVLSLLGATVVCGFLLTQYQPLWRRIEQVAFFFVSPENLAVGDSAWLRLQMIVMGLAAVAENPWTGIGMFHSKFLYYVFAEDTYSHNNYIETMLNGGLPALALFYLPMILALARIWQRRGRGFLLDRVALVLGVYKLVMDFGMVSYFDPSHVFVSAFVVLVAIGEGRTVYARSTSAGSA